MPSSQGDSSDGSIRRALDGFDREVGPEAVAEVVQQLEDANSLAGAAIGDYRLGRELGRGGMGVVYEAEQVSVPGRIVAVKLLRGLIGSATARQRFAREVEVVGRLDHPHIVPILSADLNATTPFYAMKRVDGVTLRAVLQGGAMRGDVRAIATMMRDLARALQHAHDHGVVHRDVKPGNVLVDRDGRAMLLDFGLASLVETDSDLTLSTDAVGTPDYMAPEQVTSSLGPITPRTDVYGLGVTLYECLTGRTPYGADSRHETLTRIVRGDASGVRSVEPAVPRDLENICAMAMARESGRRYGSAAEFGDDLDAFLGFRPVRARPPGWSRRVGIWLRKRRLQVIAGTVASLAFVAAAAWWGWVAPARAIGAYLDEVDTRWQRRLEVADDLTRRERATDRMMRYIERDIIDIVGELQVQLRDLADEVRQLDTEIRDRLERCLSLDARHSVVRSRYADLLAVQLQAHLSGGGVMLRREEIDSWQQRLARYDDDGRFAKLLDRRGQLRIVCAQGAARLWLCAAVEHDDGRRLYGEIGEPAARELGTAPVDLTIEEGNYAIRAQLDGHADIVLPLLLRRAAVQNEGERAIDLEFVAAEVLRNEYRQVHAGYGVVFDSRRAWDDTPDVLRWHEGFLIYEREMSFADADTLAGGPPPGLSAAQLAARKKAWSGFDWSGLMTALTLCNANEQRARTGYYVAMPTVEEWRRAARGADGRKFPWGDVHEWRFSQNYWSTADASHRLDREKSPPQDRSPFEVRDLAGSLREVCIPLQLTSTLGTKQFMTCGGSYYAVRVEELMAANERPYLHNETSGDMGIRPVRRPLPAVPAGPPRFELAARDGAPVPQADGWQVFTVHGPLHGTLPLPGIYVEAGAVVLSGYAGSFSPKLLLWHPVEVAADDFAATLAFSFSHDSDQDRPFVLQVGTQPGFDFFDRTLRCEVSAERLVLAWHDRAPGQGVAKAAAIEIAHGAACRLEVGSDATGYAATLRVAGGRQFTVRLPRTAAMGLPERFRYGGIRLPDYVGMRLLVTSFTVGAR